MKSNTQLSVKNLLTACQNAQNESVKSLVIQHNGVNFPVINASIVPQRNHSDLVLFVGAAQQTHSNELTSFLGSNQKSPQIDDLVANAISGSIDDAIKLVQLKAIFKSALEQINDLEQRNLNATNKPLGLIAAFFAKKSKPVPLNKKLHKAFLNTLETVLVSNGKNPNSFDFDTFQEIKSSLAQFSEALENYSNYKDFGGDL
jgi:hypothetical protein